MWLQGLDESVLVDPKFKEQFEIAHPTARYAALLDEVPPCFVGTEERLVALVELLCSEMSAAFRGTGALQPKPLALWLLRVLQADAFVCMCSI